MSTFTRLLSAQEAGLNRIYCADTGEHIGTLTNEEFEAFVEMEDSLHGLDSDEDFLDALELSVMAISSKPSPLFQNMTPARYQLIAEQHPERMFRYLCGKLVFERWNHINGHTNFGGKTEWLKTIDLVDCDVRELLATLIRLDGILSIRKVFFNSALILKLNKIREEWPGIVPMALFVNELESTNIEALATHDNFTAGRISGNRMAQSAVIAQIQEVDMVEFEKSFAKKRAGELLRQAAAERKAGESKRRIERYYAPLLGDGQTQIKRGIDAIMDYAGIGEIFDKNVALTLLSKVDTAKITVRQREIATAKIESKDNPKKASGGTRKPKVSFDFDFSFDGV